jgi:hypothetical protein
MDDKGITRIGMVVIVVVIGAVLAGATLQDRGGSVSVLPAPEKLCPITFHLYPVTSLQANFAADIEKTNATLAQMLVKLRTASLPDADAKSTFVKALNDAFRGSYLAKPVLIDENRKPVFGWEAILTYLQTTIMPKAIYIHPQAVNVYLEYLPLDKQTPAHLKERLGVTDLKFNPNEVDFLATIRTVIAFAPFDPPMEIGNEDPIPHRKICDPIY